MQINITYEDGILTNKSHSTIHIKTDKYLTLVAAPDIHVKEFAVPPQKSVQVKKIEQNTKLVFETWID